MYKGKINDYLLSILFDPRNYIDEGIGTMDEKDSKVGKYLIFRDGQSFSASRLHDDLNELKIEAERLCRKEEKKFLIARIIGEVAPMKVDVPIEWEWES